MTNPIQPLDMSSAVSDSSSAGNRLQTTPALWQALRVLLGFLAIGCTLLPIYAYYLQPWLEWQWTPLDQWLAANHCLIEAWCIPQFSQQPVLLMALMSLLFFALAFHRHGPLLPWVDSAPLLTYPPHGWRSWLAVALFGLLAFVAVGLQAYQLLWLAVPAVSPWLWGLGLFSALAAALLWDAEEPAVLLRTLANGLLALALAVTVMAVAAVLAGRGPLAWGILLAALLFFAASSVFSYRCHTFLQPLDHLAMLGLTLMALLLGLRYLWSWRYAFIGDEWGFLEIATTLIHRPELYQTFTTHDSNGYHTVFSSYLQAWTMVVTTENLFGWRLSSLLPMIFSVPALYAFARWWAGRTVAWLSAGALAGSHMLLSFSMVPYNNTQALLPLSLGLGCFAFAIRRNSRLRFLLVGMVVGLGFLVYGLGRLAAIPIGLLLLLHIWPESAEDEPTAAHIGEEMAASQSRPRDALMRMVGAGLAVIFGAVAVAAPMLFNLKNWQDMMMATPAESEVLGKLDPTVQMWRNVVLGAHSFLSNQKFTHFVVGPYVDPLTGLLILAGMGALVGNFWRRTRWASFLLAGWLLIFVTSALQQYDHVSNTRMFLLVLCYALFAGLGGTLLLRALAAPWGLQRERYLLLMSVPLIATVVWINQWHIVNVVQVHSQQMPIALILQQLQESAATNGGGMPVYVVADDNIQRMSLIVRAHGVPRERVHYLQGDELLASPQICGEAHEPSMALIEAAHPQLAQLEQYFAACWPGNQLAPIKNQANEVIFYRFLTQTGVDELAKAPAQRQALRVVPDTIAVRKPTSLAVSENDRLFVLAPETRRLWQLDTNGQLLHSFVITPTLPTALALTAQKEIVVAGQDPTALLTWYSPAGIVLRQLGEETVRLHPTGMVADPMGDLYVSDGDNGRIVRVSAAAAKRDEATTVAALTANGELRNPGALALAADGTLWVIDLGSRRLLQVTPDDQLRTALALPTIRELERAHLLVTGQGDLLISSPGDGRILRLNQEGQVVERSFGFQYPTALALASDGRLFVADTVVDQIAVLPPLRTALPAVALPTLTIADEQPISPLSPLYTTNPASVTDADQGADFRYIGAGDLGQPLGVAIGANGNLYVADAGRAQLAIFAPDGTLIRRVTEGDGPLEQPNDLVFDHAGTLLLLDAGRGALLTFDGEGNYQGDFLADSALLGDARGIGVAPDGSIWVASTRRGLVAQIDSQGQILLEYPSTPAADGQPVDVAVDREGRIYLVEASTLQLVQLSRLGIRRNSWSLPGFNTGHAPHLAIGADSALYLTAPEQGLVTKFDEQGRVLASWQLPRSDRDGAVKPIGIAVDAEGNMYVASAEQGVVVEIAPR